MIYRIHAEVIGGTASAMTLPATQLTPHIAATNSNLACVAAFFKQISPGQFAGHGLLVSRFRVDLLQEHGV